jgi:hypothetical protein
MPIGTQYRINLIKRYESAYSNSNELLRSSKFFDRCRILSTCFTVLLVIVGAVIAVDIAGSLLAVIPALLIGGFVWMSVFGAFKFAAMMIRSQAHILTVCLDGVLNDSPFLTDDERAEAMDSATEPREHKKYKPLIHSDDGTPTPTHGH